MPGSTYEQLKDEILDIYEDPDLSDSEAINEIENLLEESDLSEDDQESLIDDVESESEDNDDFLIDPEDFE